MQALKPIAGRDSRLDTELQIVSNALEQCVDREKIQALEAAIDLCLEARARLGSDGSSRTCLLLDMLLLDLGRQLAEVTGTLMQ